MRPVQPTPPKRKRSFRWDVWLAVLVILAGFGVVFYKMEGPPSAAPIETPTDPTFTSPDGKTMLTVPDRAMPDGTAVKFKNDVKRQQATTIEKSRLAFKPISNPVDITVTNGALMRGKVAVSIAYDPAKIPEGLSDKQVGMVVYDTTLQAWIPILNAKADPETKMVTAIAPHFSWFSAVVLDPLQNVVEVAGKSFETVIDVTVDTASWFNNLVGDVGEQFVKDLLGQAEPLKCDGTSKRIESDANAAYDALSSCVQPAGDKDRLQVRNGFAFPLLTGKLPAGVTLEMEDIWDNGEDIVSLARNAFWASQNQAYVTGANQTSLTITSAMKQDATITMEVDDEAIAYDLAFAVLAVFGPSTATVKAAIKEVMTKLTKGEDIANLLSGSASWLGQVYDTMECINSAAHGSWEAKLHMEPTDEMLTEEGNEDAAKLAFSCLESVMDRLNLKDSLSSVLSGIKVVPEFLGSMTYLIDSAMRESFHETFGVAKNEPPVVTVKRIDAATQQPSKPSTKTKQPETPTKTQAPKPALKDVARFAKTWRRGGGSLTINKDGTGKYVFNTHACAPDDPDIGQFQACIIRIPVRFVDTGSGSITGSYGTPKATAVRDETMGKSLPVPENIKAAFAGQQFELSQSTNKHIVGTSSLSGPFPGTPWMCDDYAHRFAQGARNMASRYHEQCNKPKEGTF